MRVLELNILSCDWHNMTIAVVKSHSINRSCKLRVSNPNYKDNLNSNPNSRIQKLPRFHTLYIYFCMKRLPFNLDSTILIIFKRCETFLSSKQYKHNCWLTQFDHSCKTCSKTSNKQCVFTFNIHIQITTFYSTKICLYTHF